MLHVSWSKNKQNILIFMIFARRLTKFPNFTWFLPENARILHNNCPKIFFQKFWAHAPYSPISRLRKALKRIDRPTLISLTSNDLHYTTVPVCEPGITESVVTGHFGQKTLLHQDTLGHFGTGLKTLRHQKRGTSYFDTSAVIEEKPGHFDREQFRWDTAPPVIRLKLRHQFFGAEVSRCRSVLWPKCPASESVEDRLWRKMAIQGHSMSSISVSVKRHLGTTQCTLQSVVHQQFWTVYSRSWMQRLASRPADIVTTRWKIYMYKKYFRL